MDLSNKTTGDNPNGDCRNPIRYAGSTLILPLSILGQTRKPSPYGK